MYLIKFLLHFLYPYFCATEIDFRFENNFARFPDKYININLNFSLYLTLK